jgi:hypothetical protein
LGEDTQWIQNLFVKLINGFSMLNQRFHLRDRQLIQLDQTVRLGKFLMDQQGIGTFTYLIRLPAAR